MLTWQRQIYSGTPKLRMLNTICTYTLCPERERRYIYIVSANVYIRTSVNVKITQQLALWIFDCDKLNIPIYNLHYETYSGKIVDFYSPNSKKCVLLMHNDEMKLLTLYPLLVNKETNETVEILCRNWKIDASETLRVRYGGLPFGYIVVSGYTTPEFGNVLDVRMLPADPGSVTIPAINMYKQMEPKWFIFLYFGTLFLWLSHIDGGFYAYWFIRALAWINGGRLLLNLGPNPSLYIFKLDMNCFRLSTKNVQANRTWLKLGGHAMIDVMNYGSAVMSELTHRCNIIRVTEFPPPFVPRTLCRQALNKCIELYSKLRSSEMLRLECGIVDYPELYFC
uniref:SOCS box domain-containing protein n=1 Tax=Elaeophora elaphi TaxID=1147741 RepID=A0A0R3S2X5_9BILA